MGDGVVVRRWPDGCTLIQYGFLFQSQIAQCVQFHEPADCDLRLPGYLIETEQETEQET